MVYTQQKQSARGQACKDEMAIKIDKYLCDGEQSYQSSPTSQYKNNEYCVHARGYSDVEQIKAQNEAGNDEYVAKALSQPNGNSFLPSLEYSQERSQAQYFTKFEGEKATRKGCQGMSGD